MNETLERMRVEMQDVLENNILRFWLDKMVDHENGGFYGRMDGHGQLHPQAEKGAILNARILWAFSAAYRVLSNLKPQTSNHKLQTSNFKLQSYLDAATRAKDYFIQHFIDKEYGGVYWSVDYKGNPLDTKKQFYAIGFAIYGLSEYARATGNQEALDYALQLYNCIEQHAFDAQHNGYIEACTREWGPIADMRLSELDANYPKSQNTHLHIIEPYTNLYRCLKQFNSQTSKKSFSPVVRCKNFSNLKSQISNLINIFTDKILNPETHHLDLFFEMDWTRGTDYIESYGHDIECSWLIHEAALVLGDQQLLQKVEPIVLLIAKAAEQGLRPDGSMIHEMKCPSNLKSQISNHKVQSSKFKVQRIEGNHKLQTSKFKVQRLSDEDRHWWVQAENVVGWLNLYQHFGDQQALQRADACWQYIKQNLIDYEHGEWFWSRRSDGTLNLDDDHAGFWKCPYHNSRMCLETIERFP